MLQLSAPPRARARTLLYMSVCVCVRVYEVAHLHLMTLMNFPVPLTWWVPTHGWGKGWKSLLTPAEGHLIIAYQSTPALVLRLGVIKFPFDFPQRVRAAVRRISCWDVLTAGRDLFNFSKPSFNYTQFLILIFIIFALI